MDTCLHRAARRDRHQHSLVGPPTAVPSGAWQIRHGMSKEWAYRGLSLRARAGNVGKGKTWAQ
eukprot:4930511-Lingulodinium_polyedra.AAC.1